MPARRRPTVVGFGMESVAMILAGDIGGTKCNLLVFREVPSGVLQPVFRRQYSTHDFAQLEDLVERFRNQFEEQNSEIGRESIAAAGFGVAGAVVEGRLHANNLPWVLDPPTLANKLNLSLSKLVLLNDVVATACSLDKLPPEDLAVLNKGVAPLNATRALMAVGTGLGEALLFWDGHQFRVVPSEGGVANFAPRTDREIQLLVHLKKRLPNVSCEEILSGRGFRTIHEFLDPGVRHPSFGGSGADPAREITQLAQTHSCRVCVATLDLWTEAYGSEAGNLALRVLALGGVYVAGGIAPKVLAKLKDGTFFRAFCDKAKLADVLARVPISVVLNEEAPVWGAAYQALAALRSQPYPQSQRKAG
jgi:glucokinase